jgi:hypothetical protein
MTYLAIEAMKICRIAYNIRLPKIRSGSAVPGHEMAMSGSTN